MPVTLPPLLLFGVPSMGEEEVEDCGSPPPRLAEGGALRRELEDARDCN